MQGTADPGGPLSRLPETPQERKTVLCFRQVFSGLFGLFENLSAQILWAAARIFPAGIKHFDFEECAFKF